MRMQGDWRTCLRQLHQLPVPTLSYLPLWLETLRAGLDADGVAALWCPAAGVSGSGDETPDTPCWYAPDAPLAACERLAASAWAMPSEAELRHASGAVAMLRGHARRGVGRGKPAELCRPSALDECLSGGDVLDVCLIPLARPVVRSVVRPNGVFDALDTFDTLPRAPAVGQSGALDSAGNEMRTLRLLVSRGCTRARFASREIEAFEMAAAEFVSAPARPDFPTPPATAVTAWPTPDSGSDAAHAICSDIAGTLVWYRDKPEWADPAALALMRRVWRPTPGRAWPDACVVVQACQRLAQSLTRHACGATPEGAQVCASLPVPGGTLHLHATHLCAMGGSATERVRIALHLCVPPAIRLLRRLWDTSLTPVQREIAMRLLAGQSRTQTREACAIGIQTLKTHLSLMRARLDPVRDASLLLGL